MYEVTEPLEESFREVIFNKGIVQIKDSIEFHGNVSFYIRRPQWSQQYTYKKNLNQLIVTNPKNTTKHQIFH